MTNEAAVTIEKTYRNGERKGRTLINGFSGNVADLFAAERDLISVKYTHFDADNNPITALEFDRNQFKV